MLNEEEMRTVTKGGRKAVTMEDTEAGDSDRKRGGSYAVNR